MKITILCVGKVKEKFYRDAIAEYSKRLSRYCKLEITEVSDEKTSEQATQTEIDIVKNKEGEIDGKQLDSVELSQKIDKLMTGGKSHLVFVIGGSLGLSDDVLKCADYKLSFSKMTFPHQLMRVILLEQIYRSFRISNNEPYHK